MGSEPDPGSGPLAGTRVLDLTRVLAGPYSTMLLADLGAQVIKVERPGIGDETRFIPPISNGESHYFLSINRNKLGIALDLQNPRGLDICIELAKRSDVLIENFRPGVAARLGLGYERLSEVNPRLIYCSISAFGQTGPWAERAAFDIAIQALSGAMSVTGEVGRPPIRMGLPVGDLSGGLFGAIGVLAALLERERTGSGKLVDVSLLDSMVGLLGYLAGRYFMTGEDPWPVGAGHHSIVPYGAFKAADGYIVIATLTESFWPKLCAALGLDHLAGDSRYDTNAKRVALRGEVDEVIGDVIAGKPVDDWCQILLAADVPYAPVLRISQVLSLPQVLARGMVAEADHPHLGPIRFPGRPIRFGDQSDQRFAPPPLLGQHTASVLKEVLGYNDNDIDRLVRDGAIAIADP